MVGDSSNLYSVNPGNPGVCKLLKLWLQLGRVQVKVIYRPDSQDAHPRKSAASAVHQVAADGAEAVLHRRAAGNGLVLCPP